jgi:hypothetical protein
MIIAIVMLTVMVGVMGRTQQPLYDSEANRAQLEKRFKKYHGDIGRLRA